MLSSISFGQRQQMQDDYPLDAIQRFMMSLALVILSIMKLSGLLGALATQCGKKVRGHSIVCFWASLVFVLTLNYKQTGWCKRRLTDDKNAQLAIVNLLLHHPVYRSFHITLSLRQNFQIASITLKFLLNTLNKNINKNSQQAQEPLQPVFCSADGVIFDQSKKILA